MQELIDWQEGRLGLGPVGALPPDKHLLAGQMWERRSLAAVAAMMSLAHAANETKAQRAFPLSITDIWVWWDPQAPMPRELGACMFMGYRPLAGHAWDKARLERAKTESREFWAQALGSPKAPGKVFLSSKQAFAKPRRMLLIWRDTRSEPFEEQRRAEPMFWRQRRKTLREAPAEAASLLGALGETLAYSAFGEAGYGDRTLEELALFRSRGCEIGQGGLAGVEWGRDFERKSLDFDFACRELGEAAMDAGNAQLASELFRGFFGELSQSRDWPDLASEGEQEAYFPLMCRLEPLWREYLGSF